MSAEDRKEPSLAEPRAGRGWRAAAPTMLIAVLIVACICALVIYRIATRKPDVSVAEVPPVNVKVQKLTAAPQVVDTFELPGTVEANRVVNVSAEQTGRVEKIACCEGMPCQAGDVLILLNTDLLQAEYDRAKAQAEYDAKEYARVESLVKGGAGTERMLDESKSHMAASAAGLAVAKAQLDRAKVVAPISGILNRLPVEQGEYVQPGTRVAEIVDIDTALVVTQAPERDVAYLTRGGDCEIVASVRGEDRTLTGKISYISSLADEQTRSTRVEITVDNSERLLRSGQIVRARLTRRLLNDILMIPLSAAIPLEDGKEVYVVQAGKAERRLVKLGFIKGNSVQALDGLKSGDMLIVEGQRYVGPGQVVRVTETK